MYLLPFIEERTEVYEMGVQEEKNPITNDRGWK
jgi:hypothetical protein